MGSFITLDYTSTTSTGNGLERLMTDDSVGGGTGEPRMHWKKLVACAVFAQGLAPPGSSAAMARTVTFGFSGHFGLGVGAYSGQTTLDVVGGQAISGGGFITDRAL